MTAATARNRGFNRLNGSLDTWTKRTVERIPSPPLTLVMVRDAQLALRYANTTNSRK
jgi:hypothetical protein